MRLAYFFMATLDENKCFCGRKLKKTAIMCRHCWKELPLKLRKTLHETTDDNEWFEIYNIMIHWILPLGV